MKKYITLFLALLFISTIKAQEMKNLAGQYNLGNSYLLINKDGTCYAFGSHSVVKGVVTINGSQVKIRPYKPTAAFILYGRKTENKTAESKLMFKGFKTENLVNVASKNDAISKMKRVYNSDANCFGYPDVMTFANENTKFYFTGSEDDYNLYAFDNNKGFNDFIVMHLPTKRIKINLELNKKGNGFIYKGKPMEKTKIMKEEEIEAFVKMHNAAYPLSEKYYCNPYYNDTFSEEVIDVHTGQYDKVKIRDAYFYKKIDMEEENPNDQYHHKNKIYEYTKIESTTAINHGYTVDNNPVFIYSCGK